MKQPLWASQDAVQFSFHMLHYHVECCCAVGDTLVTNGGEFVHANLILQPPA